MPTTFMASGVTPVKGDQRRALLIKTLAVLQNNAASPLSQNDPSRNDTQRRLRGKIVRSRKSITGAF